MASIGRFGSPNMHKRLNFAESNAKVSVELRQQQLQLEKEISRLEKQSKTATTNISNYQQCLKNTWRKLEQRRKESPTQEKKRKLSDGHGQSKKGLMFSTATKLSVDSATEDTQQSNSQSLTRLEDYARRGSDVASNAELANGRSATGSSSETISSVLELPPDVKNSPYISSPFSMRRATSSADQAMAKSVRGFQQVQKRGVSPLSRSKTVPTRRGSRPPTRQRGVETHLIVPLTTEAQSMAELEAKVQHIPLGAKSAASMPQTGSDAKLRSNSALKLPPISAPESKSMVNVRSTSFDKKTLLEAAQAMNFKAGSKSHGPQAFGKFYDPVLAPSIVVTVPSVKQKGPEIDTTMLEQLTEEERERLSKEEDSDGLAKMFEEIRNCRYIRHYYPHGSPDEKEDT